jgi:hypothetical protein
MLGCVRSNGRASSGLRTLAGSRHLTPSQPLYKNAANAAIARSLALFAKMFNTSSGLNNGMTILKNVMTH